MGNQHTIMQENLYEQIRFRIEEEYQELFTNELYKGERITKFNFEEVAADSEFISLHFKQIFNRIFDNFALRLTMEEQCELQDMVKEKLYELLKEDIQDHRVDNQPKE